MSIIKSVSQKSSLTPLKRVENWLPFVIWAGVIYWFSSIPMPETTKIYWQDFIVKKTAHIIEYGVFSALLYRALKGEGVSKTTAGYTAIVIAVLYGISDEYHQSMTPGRQPKVRDIFFDTIGAILAIYTIWNLLPKAPEKLVRLAKRLELL